MSESTAEALLTKLAAGRTDVVFDLIAGGCPADTIYEEVPLVQHCAYFGDVSALRYLLSHGALLDALGDDFGIIGAAFHGHWRLCQFLLEQGADVNAVSSATGETALHSALCTTDRTAHDRVLEVLLQHGADPHRVTVPGVETGAFMRDCRTKGETPLHRAAAFGGEETVAMLLEAGAHREARDAHGDTPLSWASWYTRPTPILRLLLYPPYRINPHNRGMRANLIGDAVFEE